MSNSTQTTRSTSDFDTGGDVTSEAQPTPGGRSANRAQKLPSAGRQGNAKPSRCPRAERAKPWGPALGKQGEETGSSQAGLLRATDRPGHFLQPGHMSHVKGCPAMQRRELGAGDRVTGARTTPRLGGGTRVHRDACAPKPQKAAGGPGRDGQAGGAAR